MPGKLVDIPSPQHPIYRVARRGPYTPFSPPDWGYANKDDGTFGSRFDDPGGRANREGGRDFIPQDGRYRVIYCASTAVAALGETIAPLRVKPDRVPPDPHYVDDPDDPEPPDAHLLGIVDPRNPERGRISFDWRSNRVICHTSLDPDLVFADSTDPRTVAFLRSALSDVARDLGIQEIDFSTVAGPAREFTQECARLIYEQTDATGHPRFAGIRYLSRHTPQWECWALFADRVGDIESRAGIPVSILEETPELLEVAAIFGMGIEASSGRIFYVEKLPHERR